MSYYIYCTFYWNEQKKNGEVYTANSINTNFKCGPQVEKGWARLGPRTSSRFYFVFFSS